MEDSRRRFLMLAGISAVGLTARPVLDAFAAEQKQNPKIGLKKGSDALTAKQWGMVIDTRKLESAEDLEHIIEACHKTHNVPSLENKNHEVKWIWEEHFHNAFPSLAQKFQDERTEQGLAKRRVRVEEIFHPSTLELAEE